MRQLLTTDSASPLSQTAPVTTRRSRLARAAAAVALAATSLAVVTADPASVGAELSPDATTSWGVTGNLTGTSTDSIRSEVFATEQIGDIVYMGGRFTTATNGVISEPQAALAAFDAATGDFINSWRPTLDGAVLALEASPDGSRLFVGGDFETVNGTSTGGLVALDPATGAIDTTWAGRIGGYNLVRGLDVGHGYLYAAGGFTSVSSGAQGMTAYRTARFDLTTGMIDTSWTPVIQGGSIWGVAASPTADRVYLAGYFNSSNFTFASNGFVALSSVTGENAAGVLPIEPNTRTVNRRYLYDVEVAGGYVWIVGSEHFVQVLNESDLSIHKFHMSQPSTGDFQDLEVVGDTVYAGCHCRVGSYLETADSPIFWAGWQSDPPTTDTGAMAWVVAFDADTGLRDPGFQPTITSAGPGIWAIHGSPNGCVWFGGDVTSSGGQAQTGFTRLCEEGQNPIDTERPSTPGSPQTQSLGVDSASFVWTSSTDNFGVVGYRIYAETIGGLPSGEILYDGPANSTTITDLEPGTYQIYTRAYDLAGNESYRSGFTTFDVTGAVTDLERPSTPGKPQVVSVDSDSASLLWFASTDNIGVEGYRVFVETFNGAASGDVILDTTGNSGVATGLAVGTYQVYTKAYDAAGNLSYRSGFTTFSVTGAVVDLERPSSPTGLMLDSVDATSAVLSWNASTDDVGVVGYRIYDQAGTLLLTVPTESGTLTGLTPGTYSVSVKAFDAGGNQSWRSNIQTFTIA